MRAQSLGGSPPYRYVYLFAPAGSPSGLARPTAVLGAEAPVAEAYAAGFLPPDIPSSECGPFGTVLVQMLEPVLNISVGFLRVSVSVVCFPFFFSIFGPTSCGEGERSVRAEIRDARVRR